MKKSEKAKKHLIKLREIIAKNPSPIFKMNKTNVLKTLRKTRDKMWKEKIAISH